MTRCIVCKKELPEDVKVPVRKHCRAVAADVGKKAAGTVGAVAVTAVTIGPKVVKAAPKVIKSAADIATRL